MQQENFIDLSRAEANQLIPSLESAYNGLLLQGKYLPRLSSSIVTTEYLLKVLFGQCFVPKADKISIGVLFKPVKKYEILEEIQKIPLQNGQEWGISAKRQPDKTWAINVLKSFVPNHNFFLKNQLLENDVKKFTQDQLIKIRTLDTTCGKKSQVRRFFQLSKNEQQQVQYLKQQRRKQQQEKRIQRKSLQIEEIQKEMEILGEQLNGE